MSRWFRFYDEVLNDPKAQRLEPAVFKFWVNLLCLASKNDGAIVKRDVTFNLRVDETAAVDFLTSLVEHDLLEDRGDFYIPHNWDGRQYQSDSSTERVRAFRKRKREYGGKRSGNVTVTLQNRAETEQNRTEKKNIVNLEFEKFKKAYPKRKGSQGWPVAQKFFERADVPALDLIAAAAKFSETIPKDRIGSEFVPMAESWMRKGNWREFIPSEEDKRKAAEIERFLEARGHGLNGENQTNS